MAAVRGTLLRGVGDRATSGAQSAAHGARQRVMRRSMCLLLTENTTADYGFCATGPRDNRDGLVPATPAPGETP